MLGLDKAIYSGIHAAPTRQDDDYGRIALYHNLEEDPMKWKKEEKKMSNIEDRVTF